LLYSGRRRYRLIDQEHTLLICGPTGSGKTWIACALAHQTCRQGLSARYWRVPRLFEELRTAHGDGSYLKWLKRLAKTPIVVLDDWGGGDPRYRPRIGRTCWKSTTIASMRTPP
jgi:DNA replication protein DnaC